MHGKGEDEHLAGEPSSWTVVGLHASEMIVGPLVGVEGEVQDKDLAGVGWCLSHTDNGACVRACLGLVMRMWAEN